VIGIKMILLHNALLRRTILFLILCTCLFADNKYPIIFVHGFMGWGPDEMAGYKYWGGKNDITNYLKEQGFEVYTASVGPVSSNWDRAVELFYQIKGGQVDYGQDHAKTYGLIQKPEAKNFPGLYPDWDQNHPIHIIGHSMGGKQPECCSIYLKVFSI
jgi:triacylglycerol lipase